MEVQAFLLTENIITDQTGKKSLIGIYRSIMASTFPVVRPQINMYAELIFRPAEFGRTVSIAAVLVDEDGKQMLKSEGIMTVPQPTEPRATRHIFSLEIQLNGVVFEKEGSYEVSLLVDNDIKSSHQIDVFLQSAFVQ